MNADRPSLAAVYFPGSAPPPAEAFGRLRSLGYTIAEVQPGDAIWAVRLEHPTLGPIWVITPEDLVLAKLEWSEGTSELQVRDVRSIIRLVADLDWPYLERYAATLGISDRLEAVRAD